MWTYVHREFFTIFGQCINVLNYNIDYRVSSNNSRGQLLAVFGESRDFQTDKLYILK